MSNSNNCLNDRIEYLKKAKAKTLRTLKDKLPTLLIKIEKKILGRVILVEKSMVRVNKEILDK